MFTSSRSYKRKTNIRYFFKPTTVLAFVERSQKHIEEFGENKEIIWKPDGSAIVIQVRLLFYIAYYQY